MAGSMAALGIAAATALLSVGLIASGGAAVHSQRLAGAADASALAAADAATGAVSGVPCVRAAEIAQANGVALLNCQLAGAIATVSVSSPFGHWEAFASARAGPPPVGIDS